MIEELKFGDKEVFSLLKDAMNDNTKIEEIYSSIIKKLLASEYWSTNNEAPRVKWYDGETAKESRREVFNCSGLYLWGADSVPRYIGKAERQSFKKRFRRYIFGENSQCDLANIYKEEIIPADKGIDGFPNEIRAWFQMRRLGTVRLRHAVDFARHGIDNIWFTLFPADREVADYIGAIEKILIRVAYNWNIKNKLDPLINEQHI